MNRHDYVALFDRLAERGVDRRLHWASGPRAGSSEPWDGDAASIPGERSRLYGAACHEGPEGTCYAETLRGQARLLILGAGHVGTAVAALGATLGFHVTVVDERGGLADAARLPGAHEVLCGPYDEVLAQLPPYGNSYVVIVTPGHRLDAECAAGSLHRPFEYVGMIGSRGKVAAVRQRLLDQGFSEEEWAQVHAPIGLPLGGREPAEIAVSICAQLIQVRAARGAQTIEPAVRDAIVGLTGSGAAGEGPESGPQAVLATIIGHGGSTPRGAGSRMLVGPTGILAGSVGGGAVEAAVIERCAGLLAGAESSSSAVELHDYDLSDREGADLGMICGGRVRVLFERL